LLNNAKVCFIEHFFKKHTADRLVFVCCAGTILPCHNDRIRQ
jgi:hypothetical protein